MPSSPLSALSLATSAAIALLAAPSSAYAATFDVDDASDAHDTNPGDGICRASRPHGCTLRAAIEEATATAAHDIIRVPGPTTYTLALGQLLVGASVSIRGESGVVVDGNAMSRVFSISGGGVTISDVTIRGGRSSDDQGAGVYVGGDAEAHLVRCVVERNYSGQPGSGIANWGELHIERTSVRENQNLQTDDAGGGVTTTGGGIHNGTNAMLIVEQSAIVDNLAFRGGGISNFNGHVWITDSTISGNEARSRGAGILVESMEGYLAEVVIERSTITSNELRYVDINELIGGGGIANVMSYVGIHASIVAGNEHEDLGLHEYAPDCADFGVFVGDEAFGWLSDAGEFASDSYNLVGSLEGCDSFDPATEDIVPIDDEPIDPELGPLTPWTAGGTELHIPSAQSPARRAGPRCTIPPIHGTPVPDCFDVDQRGYLRGSVGMDTDIGAYEGDGTAPPPSPRGG